MTPAGMTFSTLAGMAGGGLQTPGVMGVGKYFISAPSSSRPTAASSASSGCPAS
jgi:CO dehydrogenase/acetyl-CoA synthase beta subunit